MRKPTGYKQKLRSERTQEERDQIAQWVALQDRTEQEWLERIEALPEDVQGPIARMVWWDFGAEIVVSERWTLLDKYLKYDTNEETNPIPRQILEKHLSEIGYPEYRVNLRLKALDRKFNPGTYRAKRAGCTCPVMDNGNGKGYMGQKGIFVYNSECKYHNNK